MTTESGATVNSYPSCPRFVLAFAVVNKIAPLTPATDAAGATVNWQPVDFWNSVARYWAVCNEGPSARIFVVARPGKLAAGIVGHNVNRPGRIWTDCGSGMRFNVGGKTTTLTVLVAPGALVDPGVKTTDTVFVPGFKIVPAGGE